MSERAWQWGHRPSADGAPLHNIQGDPGKEVYPDFYARPNIYTWEDTKASLPVIKDARGKPDMIVRIYRGLPREHGTMIHPGDWVSIEPEYAKRHGFHAHDPAQDWPVIVAEVPAHTLRNPGDSIAEWGYFGDDPVEGRYL